MVKEYKNNFKQQIHDIINCWIYNIEDTLSNDIIDLTNTILIITNKFDVVIKRLDKALTVYEGIDFTKIDYGKEVVFTVKKFFKRYDLDFLLKFKVVKDKGFKDVKGTYSCVLIYMDQNRFKRWFKEDKINKLLNKESNNMYRDYNVILLC